MILVVDDHADTRNALVDILALEGYTAHAVSTAREAMQLVDEVQPRLLILDYGLPDMDGLSLFGELRQRLAPRKIPVIMFSAHGSGDVRARALAAGVDAYITKASLDWSRLNQEIARLAGPPPIADRLPPQPDEQGRDCG